MAKGIVKIKVLGDASDLHKAVDGVHSKLGGLTGSIGKLAGAFAGLMIVGKAVDFFQESAKAAMEDAQAKDILHTAIRNVTGANEASLASLDKWIEKTQAATGFTEEQLRPAMVKLTSATKDVGQAQDILAIAMDTSKARGVSLETVTLALEKAQNGQTTGLQRLGIATKDASGNALSFDDILKNLAATYGGTVAAAADTTQGKMERMKLIFGEVKESVGAALLPVIEKFATFIMDNMPTIQGIMETFAGMVGTALDVLSKTVLPLLQQVFEKVWPAVQKVVEGFVTWLSGEQGQKLIETVMSAIGLALGALQTIFETVWPIIQDAVKLVFDFFADNEDVVKAVFDAIGLVISTLGEIFKTAWRTVIKPAVEFAFKFFTDNKQTILDLFGAIMKVVKDLEPVFQLAFDIAGKLMSGIGKPLLDAIGKVLGVLLTVITKIIEAVDWFLRLLGLKSEYESKPFDPGAIKAKSPVVSHTPAPTYNFGGPKQHGGPLNITQPAMFLGHPGEYVLTKGDTSLMQRLISAVERGGMGSGGIGPITVYITGQGTAAGEAAADALVRRLAAAGVRL